MIQSNLWAIWHTELKMWLRTGNEYRKYAHTSEEVMEWIENYKKDSDKSEKWLHLVSVDDIIENSMPLYEQEKEPNA